MVCLKGNGRRDQPTQALSLPIVASSREKLLARGRQFRLSSKCAISACTEGGLVSSLF
jgi:hypothetical protein